MLRSMYARLVALFLSVIVLSMCLVGVLVIMTVRADRIDARMNELKTQAREIAWLASQVEFGRFSAGFLIGDNSLERYMQWKARSIYDEFHAYILVVDRNGRMKHNMYTTLEGGEDVTESLNAADLQKHLSTILSGHEIELRTTSAEGPVFTVGVPWIEGGDVWGAVFIHTAAQNIHAVYQDVVWQVMLVTLLATMAAVVAAFFFTRQITRPLTNISHAAEHMAQGTFEPIAPVRSTREVAQLARVFNDMGVQLNSVEQSRRDFVANVSHELRSPVTSIQGYVQGLSDGTVPPESRERCMRVVVDETRRLSRLIANLLSLSRMEESAAPPNKTAFDLNELARRVIIRRGSLLDEKKLNMDVDFALDPCMVRADYDMIEQVVTNLLDNAIKFTPEGGQIELTTRRENGAAVLCVRDNGSGVLPADAPHIFERFYKADKAHTVGKGTGLGLAICKRIMDMHGKTIRLLHTETGAAFEITLDIAAEQDTPHADI